MSQLVQRSMYKADLSSVEELWVNLRMGCLFIQIYTFKEKSQFTHHYVFFNGMQKDFFFHVKLLK